MKNKIIIEQDSHDIVIDRSQKDLIYISHPDKAEPICIERETIPHLCEMLLLIKPDVTKEP